jgi:solute carrier family 25 carnitine/acylcarnitine transporter 20/29
MLEKLFAGGMAGVTVWGVSYPFDVLKSNFQSKEGKAPSMGSEAIRLYRKYGTRYFFKGVTPCLARAFPVNAVTLVSYDGFSSLMLRLNN